jgi:uncharacterized membrane protein
MYKRVMGVAMLLVAIAGLSLSIGGVIVTDRVLNEIEQSLDTTLRLAVDSLETVGETLALTRETADQVSTGLSTASVTAINVSQAIDDTQPLVEQVTQVVTEDVPDSLSAVERAVPNIAVAAGAIHDTLAVLDSFQADRRILGVPIRLDLGIEYNPSVPLDETVLELGDILGDVPDSLRALDVNLYLANESLLLIGQNVESMAEDLLLIEGSIGQIEPMLDDYLKLVTDTSDLIRQTRANLAQKLQMTRLIITIVLIWIGLNQIVPIYLGRRLLWGQRRGEDVSTNG